MMQEKKAQTALEMLILLAGAILVAAGIGIYLKSIPPKIENVLNSKKTEVINELG